jgi:hypothetical protein
MTGNVSKSVYIRNTEPHPYPKRSIHMSLVEIRDAVLLDRSRLLTRLPSATKAAIAGQHPVLM